MTPLGDLAAHVCLKRVTNTGENHCVENWFQVWFSMLIIVCVEVPS